MAKITFSNTNNDFYQSLKTSVEEYFAKNKIRKTGDWRLFSKTIILIGTAVTMYSLILFAPLSSGAALLVCVVLGISLASIGFSVMHDANHGSYSTKPWLNDLLGLTINALGASAYFWKQKHNVIHHTYTNVDGIDDDIAKSPFLRHCETQKWVPAHQVQFLYLLPLYFLSTLFWIFFMDFSKYFSRKIFTTDAWKMTPKNHFVFWLTKILYITFYMVFPVMVWGFLPWLTGYLLLNAVMGVILTMVFQLAHVVEGTAFEHVSIDETIQTEQVWAEHQMKTTSNFAMGNKIISWFVGGLNYQIEHHLFPRVSHVHYPAISKIVIEKCKEYHLPYLKYDTLFGAVASHFRVMRFLGKKPVPVLHQIKAA